MNKLEFLQITSKEETKINDDIYATIEKLYLSENEYHQANGGVNETKQDFCKRVFITSQNTEKTLIERLITEVVKENNFFIHDKTTQDQHELAIRDHYNSIAKWN